MNNTNNTKPLRAYEVTDDMLRALRREAAAAGDTKRAAICALALRGFSSDDERNEIGRPMTALEARAICAEVISNARAVED